MEKGKLSHFMPVSVYSVKLGINKEERDAFCRYIDKSVANSNSDENKADTWTGDFYGHHQLHNQSEYSKLFSLIGEHLKEYVAELHIDKDTFDYNYVRSWGTKQSLGNRIEYHRHDSAHFSLVYYPSVPEDSGNFFVATEHHQNEIIPGLFRREYFEQGVVHQGQWHTLPEIEIKAEDDLLMIFPSKTLHRTGKSTSQHSRYSISSDIICTLKNADGFEVGIPPIETWKKA